MSDRLIKPSLTGQRNAQVGARLNVTGVDGQGLRKMVNCLVRFPLFEQSVAQVCVCQPVIRSHAQRVLEKRHTVLPASHLVPRTHRQRCQHRRCRHRKPDPTVSPPRDHVRDAPRYDYEQADQRHISVSVRRLVIADLQDADDRYESDNVPRPTHAQISITSRQAVHQGAD